MSMSKSKCDTCKWVYGFGCFKHDKTLAKDEEFCVIECSGYQDFDAPDLCEICGAELESNEELYHSTCNECRKNSIIDRAIQLSMQSYGTIGL